MFVIMTFDYQKFLPILIKFCIFYIFLSLINKGKVIKIDNIINDSLYQENLDFSSFETKYKVLAIYYTDYVIKKTDIIDRNSLIDKQVKLAKNHGIYGFGIVYNWINNKTYNEAMLNLLTQIDQTKFPFFIILNCNSNDNNQNNIFLNKNISYNKSDKFKFIINTNKFFKAENYIKLTGKPILGIFHSSFITNEFINEIRKCENENNMNNLFILSISNGQQNLNYLNSTNSIVEFTSPNIGLSNELNQKYYYNFYYYNLFKEENIKNQTIKNYYIINGCQPEKFYIMFIKYLNFTFKLTDTFILFNAWNNYKENSYLEPSEEYGYAYLNYFSKAIFNIDNNVLYDFTNLNDKCKIAVQAHIYYEDLIEDIINKTNNIPVKFDLYITVPFQSMYIFLEDYIKQNSKAYNYDIIIVENKGRDVLPLITQMKSKYKQYKYICHIHSKKSQTSPEIGYLWRNYLYNNLLGNINIISEILHEFEDNKKLGLIFPETFFGIIKHFFILTDSTKKWMNFLSSYLFPEHELGELINFPAGNMFWAKVKAIYQIFIYDFLEYFPAEDDQTNNTIMHGIERIWLYLVKFNHFQYKIIFKSF